MNVLRVDFSLHFSLPVTLLFVLVKLMVVCSLQMNVSFGEVYGLFVV